LRDTLVAAGGVVTGTAFVLAALFALPAGVRPLPARDVAVFDPLLGMALLALLAPVLPELAIRQKTAPGHKDTRKNRNPWRPSVLAACRWWIV